MSEKLLLIKSLSTTDYLLISFAFALPISTLLSNVLLALTLGSCLYKKKYWYDLREVTRSPSIQILLAFIIWLCIGTAFYSSGLEQHLSFKPYKLVLIPLLMPAFTKNNHSLVITAFVYAMTLTLALAFIQKIPGLEFALNPNFSPGAIFKNHITSSFLMALACFFIAHQWHTNEKYAGFKKTIVGLMIFYMLFMNAGRTGYIILFTLFIIFFWQLFKIRGTVIGSIAAIILAGFSYQFSPKLTERVNSSYQEYQSHNHEGVATSTGLRVEFLKNSWQLFKQKPLSGWGTGSFPAAYETIVAENTMVKTTNPHNQFVLYMVENGIIGLLLFLSFLIYCFKVSFTLPKPQAYMFQGVLVSFSIGSLGNSLLFDFTEAHIFCLFCALFLSSIVPGSKLSH